MTDVTIENNSQKSIAGLYLKIATITGEIGGLTKAGRNAEQKYNYTTAEDVYEAIAPLLSKHKLVIVPSIQSVEQLEDSGLARLHLEFLIACGDTGASLSLPYITDVRHKFKSGAFDDKAVSKGSTQALKYFIIQLFKIPCNDIPESDNDRDNPKEYAGHSYAKSSITELERELSPKDVVFTKVAKRLYGDGKVRFVLYSETNEQVSIFPDRLQRLEDLGYIVTTDFLRLKENEVVPLVVTIPAKIEVGADNYYHIVKDSIPQYVPEFGMDANNYTEPPQDEIPF